MDELLTGDIGSTVAAVTAAVENVVVDTNTFYGALVIALIAIYKIIRSLLVWKGKAKSLESLEKYKPFALSAMKWVEKKVPADYGTDTEDSATAKTVRKLKLFVEKFTETVAKFDGKEPSEALKAEAMKWTVELNDRLTKKDS